MDKTAQESIRITLPKPLADMKSKVEQLGERFGRGYNTQDYLLDSRGNFIDKADSVGGYISDKAREWWPRESSLEMDRSGREDNVARAGSLTRHYGPHALALLAALAGGWGLKSLMSKEGSDQGMDKQAQEDFLRGFEEKLASTGMEKEAILAALGGLAPILRAFGGGLFNKAVTAGKGSLGQGAQKAFGAGQSVREFGQKYQLPLAAGAGLAAGMGLGSAGSGNPKAPSGFRPGLRPFNPKEMNFAQGSRLDPRTRPGFIPLNQKIMFPSAGAKQSFLDRLNG